MSLNAFDAATELTVHANGVRIHATVVGDSGPVVLLCHGFPESSTSWHHQLEALSAAGFRAVAMDMRGYGRSSKPVRREEYSILKLVDDCVGVVEAIGESTAVVVGHDFGAPVAWTAAWTRPDVFRGVVGMGLPFAGRGLAALPTDPMGARRPSDVHVELAGEGLTFYQDYFAAPDGGAEREMEGNLRTYLTDAFYSLSAEAPLPPELAEVDLMSLPTELVVAVIRHVMCVENGRGFGSRLARCSTPLPWLPNDELDRFVAELESGGVRAPLTWYSTADLSWTELEPYEDRPLTVPALFLGGDRDITTIWSRPAAAVSAEHTTDLRGSVILEHCGHWMSLEQPAAVTEELLTFLKGL